MKATKNLYKAIDKCRICGNPCLPVVLDFESLALTGIFPKKVEEVPASPLVVVKCDDSDGKSCGLVQLKHTTQLDLMYGENYGYRTGLNRVMVAHVQGLVKKALQHVSFSANGTDVVLDIGSNDSTLLQAYAFNGVNQVRCLGVDPSAEKFKMYYPETIERIPDFFSKDLVLQHLRKGEKVKVITSISMFYDLEEPMMFMKNIYDLLDSEGIWMLEQSYLPLMIKKNSFDTICHEHLEYYDLRTIQWMADRVGFKIIHIDFNDINGGSFQLILSKTQEPSPEMKVRIEQVLKDEQNNKYSSAESFEKFKARIKVQQNKLMEFLEDCQAKGKKVIGYGASTKGNVLLQHWKFNQQTLPYIAEVNETKFGSVTPGTGIPIISEQQAHDMKPDYFFVLPWHFRTNIIQREHAFLNRGGQLVFPLPEFDLVGSVSNP